MASNSISRQFKHIDDRTKLLVQGYIRNSQLLLSSRYIPEPVAFICLLFYAITESFDDNMHDERIVIESSKTHLHLHHNESSETSAWRNAFGTYEIDSKEHCHCIIEWTIKVDISHRAEPTPKVLLAFGIVQVSQALDNKLNGYCFGRSNSQIAQKTYSNYGWHVYDRESHKNWFFQASAIMDAPTIKANSVHDMQIKRDAANTIQLILNIPAKTFECVINERKDVLPHADLQLTGTYRFVLALFDNGFNAEICDFRVTTVE